MHFILGSPGLDGEEGPQGGILFIALLTPTYYTSNMRINYLKGLENLARTLNTGTLNIALHEITQFHTQNSFSPCPNRAGEKPSKGAGGAPKAGYRRARI